MSPRVFNHVLALVTVASVTGFASLAAVGPARAVTIDTFPSWNGSDYVFPWGSQYSPTYGQTITVDDPSGLILDSFSVSIRSNAPQNYEARVYEWDPLKPPIGGITGLPLFSSVFGTTSGGSVFETVAVNTGGIVLPGSGKKYVLLLTTLGLPPNSASGDWGLTISNVYTGGAFYYSNNSNLSDEWGGFPQYDLAFSASLREVPGPLPIAGASVAFAFSRKLRRRIKGADAHSQC